MQIHTPTMLTRLLANLMLFALFSCATTTTTSVDASTVGASLNLTHSNVLSLSVKNGSNLWLVVDRIVDVDRNGWMNVERIAFRSGVYIGKTAGISTPCVMIAPNETWRESVDLNKNYKGLEPGRILPTQTLTIGASKFETRQSALEFMNKKQQASDARQGGAVSSAKTDYAFHIAIHVTKTAR